MKNIPRMWRSPVQEPKWSQRWKCWGGENHGRPICCCFCDASNCARRTTLTTTICNGWSKLSCLLKWTMKWTMKWITKWMMSRFQKSMQTRLVLKVDEELSVSVSVSISVNRFTNTGYHNICLPWLFMHNWDSTNTVSSFTHG